jgi:hypothetical protein
MLSVAVSAARILQTRDFLDALFAIARADGKVTREELNEIDAVPAEFGLARAICSRKPN